MICSEARLTANRQNAQKSTGPRTPEGKAKASQNALKHGLAAQGASLLPTEDPEQYHACSAAIVQSLHPATPLESELAHRIADLSWRLRRIPDAEAAILARDVEQRLARVQQSYDKALAQHEEYCRHRPTKKHLPDPPPPPDLTPVSAAWSLATTFCVTDQRQNPFLNLQRYEQSLDRARARAIKELRQLQKDRRDHPPDEERQIEPTGITPAPQPQLPPPLQGTSDQGSMTRSEEGPVTEPQNEPTATTPGTQSETPNVEPEIPNLKSEISFPQSDLPQLTTDNGPQIILQNEPTDPLPVTSSS